MDEVYENLPDYSEQPFYESMLSTEVRKSLKFPPKQNFNQKFSFLNFQSKEVIDKKPTFDELQLALSHHKNQEYLVPEMQPKKRKSVRFLPYVQVSLMIFKFSHSYR